MPEGPEIRRAADKIAAVLENEVIEELFLGLERLKKFRRILMGARVCSIETRGKALLTHFNTDWTLYSHNQLYGVWRVVECCGGVSYGCSSCGEGGRAICVP